MFVNISSYMQIEATGLDARHLVPHVEFRQNCLEAPILDPQLTPDLIIKECL